MLINFGLTEYDVCKIPGLDIISSNINDSILKFAVIIINILIKTKNGQVFIECYYFVYKLRKYLGFISVGINFELVRLVDKVLILI